MQTEGDSIDPLDTIKLEPRPIDTFTKYYPNWIPSGEDADNYRYDFGECKGEIESYVMKKTPGRKKRVKFAVVYNPKSGKRVTKAIQPKKKPSSSRSTPTRPKRHSSDEIVTDVKSNSPAISSNEVSSSSDVKGALVECASGEGSENELPHSTTGDIPAPSGFDIIAAAAAAECPEVETNGVTTPTKNDKRKRGSILNLNGAASPDSKRAKVEKFNFSDSESEEEVKVNKEKLLQMADLTPEEGEEEESSLFLNSISNIYVKSPDCLKTNNTNILSPEDP